MKKAIVVVSFGTSYKETREKTIDKIEEGIESTFSDFQVKRAFTSNRIIKKLKERDNIEVHTPLQAIEGLINEGVGVIYVQSLHVIPGFEYEKIKKAISQIRHAHKIVIQFGLPLLYREQDYDEVVTAVLKELPPSRNDTSIVLMGHGTEHPANASYSMLQNKFRELREDIYIANVEGYPEIDHVIRIMKPKANVDKVILAPLMIVAGDHAINDMASDDHDSLKSILQEAGYDVTCIMKGLGQYPGIQDAFINRVKSNMDQSK